MGILAAGVANFIAGPIRQYLAISNRATMASVGDLALRIMASDIQAAVPNTVRITNNGQTLELMHTSATALYRVGSASDGEGLHFSDALNQYGGDQYFRILGTFDETLIGEHSWWAILYPMAAYKDGDMDLPLPGFNVYANESDWAQDGFEISVNDEGERMIDIQSNRHFGRVRSSKGVTFERGANVHLLGLDDLSASGQKNWKPNAAQDIVKLDIPHTFAQHSPHRRMYFADTPITFHCDNSGRLMKYWDYNLSEIQPVPGTSRPPLNSQSAIVADGISQCAFNFEQSNGKAFSLVLMTMEFAGHSGENVTLSQRVHIRNDP
jgi:hypothetical protein